MISSAFPLLYTEEHIVHAPQVEFEQGTLIPYRESPARVAGIYQHLLSRGAGFPVRVRKQASIDDLFSIHSLQMLDFLQAVSNSVQDEQTYIYPELFPIRPGMTTKPKNFSGRLGAYCTDIYSPVGAGTWRAALSAAGISLAGADLLLRREASFAYALTRPPGHHSGPDFFGSYCYINNAALAAARLMALGRVAIIDVDYHHGNGTQAVFWDEPRVLYTSLHIDPRYDFPYFTGYAHETGGPQAPGSTLNIPLLPGTDSAGYLEALEALLTTVRAFQPAALVVSLGFDPYTGDPLSAFRVEAGAYSSMGGRIASLNLPTLLVQEGGYAEEALPFLAENFVTGFLSGLPSR